MGKESVATDRVRPRAGVSFRGPEGRSKRGMRTGGVGRGHSRILGPMRSLHLRLAAVAAMFLLAADPALAAYHQLEEIPVESPVYRLAEDLASSYAVSSGLLLTKPWTRADLGRFLDQLVIDAPAAARDPAVLRLQRELEPAGGFAGLEPMLSSEQDDVSLEVSPYLRVGYAENRSRSALVRDHRAGVQVSVAFGEHAILFADAYAGTKTPGPHGTPDVVGSFTANSTDVTAWVDRGYAMWAGKGFMVRAGHTWLRWGPGADGTMALSDAAPAFDVLEARAKLPGGAQYSWFVASLDPALESYLAGHRLDLRAGPSVELSFSELARFNGAGNAMRALVPVVPFALLGRAGGGSNNGPQALETNNVMYAADFSWTWRPGVRLYAEVALDDVKLDNSRPLQMAWQAGAHLRRRTDMGVWSLRGEYSRVYPFTYAANNGHHFVHAGFPTGSDLGPDADRLSARLEWRPNAVWAVGAEGSNLRDGSGVLGVPWSSQAVPTRLISYPFEQDQRYALTIAYSPSPSFTLAVSAGSAAVSWQPSNAGRDTDGAFGSARATFRW